MAYENAVKSITKLAAGDLSAAQYKFVALNSAGKIAVAGEAAAADGVLQDAPAALDRAGAMAISGETKIVLGGTVAAGDDVSSDSSGRAVVAGTGDVILGRCTQGGTVGLIGAVVFQPRNSWVA